MKNKLPPDLPILDKGSFYLILDGGSDIILEDKTKRGLEIKETSIDTEFNIMADKGMIHDMDGIGHWVTIRKFFPKNKFTLNHVLQHAKVMEEKYTKLRELTCPD